MRLYTVSLNNYVAFTYSNTRSFHYSRDNKQTTNNKEQAVKTNEPSTQMQASWLE